MNRAFRIAFHACIMLSLAVFVGCSDDDPAAPPPGPAPDLPLAGTVGVYADDAGTDRNIIDTGGVVTVYVVHKITGGATASQFKIEAPAGWTLMGADHQIELHIGDFYYGIAYAYGECLTGTIHLTTLTYQSPGSSAGLTFKVVPDNPGNYIWVVDCNSNRLEDGVGLTSTVTQP